MVGKMPVMKKRASVSNMRPELCLTIDANILRCLKQLLVFTNEEKFQEALNSLKYIIKERGISKEIIGEVIAAFIIERCDNLLANISLEEQDVRSVRKN